MPWSKDHTQWLVKRNHTLTTSDGKPVTVYDFTPDHNNQVIMKAWAKHFRNHYTFDTEIDSIRSGTGFSRKDYLNNLKFPSTARGFGPGIRAGDFGEIMMADYLEYILEHVVPRTRFGNKTIRDESTKGSDLIGFKVFDETKTDKDILTVIEVKTQFSGVSTNPRLQDAVDDSGKDDLRLPESLNAMKQRLLDKCQVSQAELVSRFQNPTDIPYNLQQGAAALFCNSIYDDISITNTNTALHPNKKNLSLILVRANDFMDTVHKLYEIAANEA